MSHSATVDPRNPGAIPSITIGKFGMWIFLVSEIMFFTGLIGSYIVLRLGSDSWPNPLEILNIPLLTINTLILITSSLTMVLSVLASQNKDQKSLEKNLLWTAALGFLFLVIKIFDYHHMWTQGLTISSNLFGSSYYLLTGFHGLHVLSAIITVFVIYLGARKGMYLTEKPDRIESVGLYWHFIDVVWVILFAAICLI